MKTTLTPHSITHGQVRPRQLQRNQGAVWSKTVDRKRIARIANISILVMVGGGIIYYFGMEYVGGTIFVIGFLGVAMYGGILINMSLYEPPNSVPGIEDLPPFKDIEVVLIDTRGDGKFLPVDEDRAKRIKKRLYASKRTASTSGLPKITRIVRLRDKWGGEWEVRAIRTSTGDAEFCINRVYYAGRSVQALLRLLGI